MNAGHSWCMLVTLAPFARCPDCDVSSAAALASSACQRGYALRYSRLRGGFCTVTTAPAAAMHAGALQEARDGDGVEVEEI